jgi:hypothetical protein
MEAACSSETSVDFDQITLCYIPEDKIFQNWISFKKNLPCSSSRFQYAKSSDNSGAGRKGSLL